MKTLRIGVDGTGNPRLESLPLPFLSPGPTATSIDKEMSPDPNSVKAVVGMRAAAHSAGWRDRVTAGRQLFLMISGSLRIAVPQMQARIGPGDVLFLDLADGGTSGAQLIAETNVQLVEITVEDSWSRGGQVPPALEEARRSVRTSPRLRHLASRDGLAHLSELAGFFDQAATQTVNALSFVSLSPGMTSDWHTEAGVSLLVVLSGGFVVEVGGEGGRETLRAGDVCLVEDFDGQGHKSASDGETRFAVLSLPSDHQYGVRT